MTIADQNINFVDKIRLIKTIFLTQKVNNIDLPTLKQQM